MTERRGARPHMRVNPERVGLPVRPFLYSLEQIAMLIDVTEKNLRTGYIYFQGRSTGIPTRQLILARNIAPPDSPPEWRVAEREFLRWLKMKGFKVYEAAAVTS